MSTPRPFHQPHREIRTTPDESEPASSLEDQYLLEEDVADDFHDRLAKSRRDNSGSGGSFWRTLEGDTNGRPQFSSVKMHKSGGGVKESRNKSSGLLGATLQTQTSADTMNTSNTAPAVLTSIQFDTGVDREDSNSTLGSNLRRFDSVTSNNSSGSGGPNVMHSGGRDAKKKDITRQRDADRRHKLEGLEADLGFDPDTIEDQFDSEPNLPPLPNFAEMHHGSSLERSSSDQSTGSLLYGKTPSSGTLLGKSSSLIFPTGVEVAKDVDTESDSLKRRKVNLLLDQCESIRFPFKKKLSLSNLALTSADIPLNYLCGTSLGNSLHKLSMAGNRLGSVPARLVQSLPSLKHLDLSQCELHQLPDRWNLPQLKRLNLSHNRLRDFPEESMLEGLPEMQELNMYGNKVAEIIIPHNPTYMYRLEILNLGYNDLAFLPDDLDQVRNLKTLKVMNNFLEKVPMRVCDMDLRTIDVSSNPVIEPPIETCERGICSMKRYYQCLRTEAQSKQKVLDDRNRGSGQKTAKKKDPFKRKAYGSFMKSLSAKPTPKLNSPTSPVSQRSAEQTESDRGPASSLELGASSTPIDFDDHHNALDHASKAVGEARARHRRINSESLPLETTVEGIVSPRPRTESFDVGHRRVDSFEAFADLMAEQEPVNASTEPVITVNDTLKVIFVGMAMVGKTSMIKRLIEGKDAVIPTHDERTIGVDIYEWDPKKDRRFAHIDSRIDLQDKELQQTCGQVDVKFSVWDFAGQSVYHATHELFFSPRSLYVLVWDMGATNRDTMRRKSSISDETGAFKLCYDSSDDEKEEDENEDTFSVEEEARRADRALERDIDEKVQFWIDCIQSSAPGSAILPVASFADFFVRGGGDTEAKRRCNLLKQRLLRHEDRRMKGIKNRLKEYVDQNRANDPAAARLRKLLCSYTRPKLVFGDDDDNSVVRVSGTQYTGFADLTEKIIGLATGRDKGRWQYPIFRGHVGARIPRMRLQVREAVRIMRDRFKVVEWGYFINQLRDRDLTSVEDISDALHFLTNIGELSYFGGVMTADQKNPAVRGSEMDAFAPCISGNGAVDALAGMAGDDDDDEVDEDNAILSMDDSSITAPTSDDGSMSTVEDFMSTGLSQFVFLNPRWLVAAVACILRHDLDREIKETRRLAHAGNESRLTRGASSTMRS